VATNLTGLPERNYEYIQVVRYTPGQHYNQHMDTSDSFGRSSHGHRIYTLLVYLTDVEEGGETHFPFIGEGITVAPKQVSLFASICLCCMHTTGTNINHKLEKWKR